ncbi:DUF6975 family protein [Sphingomonas sp. SUN039]|uniref:DUF6975 family protein n=1 Tax=Sphingomonas sp. SUN039 TaxID=2937787 RepID=UPI00216403DC|nr:hypothetical protein [Sphingomonas sp. SUN039]UVO53530.1 hypothetical protein M0209_05125 [Sphingomonas sp. SUN039]
MATQTAPVTAKGPATSALTALVVREASASHPHVRSLLSLDSARDTRNAADALHHLSMLHGRHPGVIDHAAVRTLDSAARKTLFALADAFAAEREALGRVVVAAGPIPSTPGQAQTEASVIAQHHAIDMLAQSDRQGCALGAAIALALDWHAIRCVIDAAAKRFGVDLAISTLPPVTTLGAAAEAAATSPAIERAALFGAQQIVTQHRGLWDLLEARALSRVDD